jgi:hypothetical protein
VSNHYGDRIHAVNSAVQNKTNHSNQTSTITITETHKTDLAGLVKAIRDDLPRLQLTPREAEAVEADLGTIELQLKKPEPKASLLRDCLGEVAKTVSVKATEVGIAATCAWLHHLPVMLGILSGSPT